ncbi:unannotated protein [freshwater metagenome]|uniref:Unannotated protein n=1 Tax=freshwater metagenome TaxID=449393 RepID=A0A6J7XSQ3_9ZZZZ|nr:hypothetical protein [Actinomycetota bacterium]
MINSPDEVTVVTTDHIVDEEIAETYGYVSSTSLSYFIVFKGRTVENSLDRAFNKIQFQAFREGADAIVGVRTHLEFQSQFLLITRVNVFMEGTMVVTKDEK